MDDYVLDFLCLIKETLNGNAGKEHDYSKTNWKEVIGLARESSMLGIIFKRLKELDIKDEVMKGYLAETEKYMLSMGIAETIKKGILREICRIAKEEEIPVLVFKGVVLSALYPEPSMRYSSDTDLYINESERQRMVDVLLRLGYEFDEIDSNEHVVKYYLPQKHYIELHSRLWSFVKGTKMDVLDNMKLTEKRIHGVFDGVECDTLDHGEHLIFLMFHLYKHLMFEHATIRFVTDIMLFFRAYYKEMNLARMKEQMVTLEYWDFFSQLYEISVRYLGFERIPAMEELEPTAYDEEAAMLIIRELMLLDRDEFDEENQFQLTYNMMPYLTGDNHEKDKQSKWEKRLHYLFPGVKEFPEEYPYVKKYPILLPVGWIHRILHYVFDQISGKKRIKGTERMEKVDAKVDRLRKMRLFK